jgi:cytoplasmic tRNA 2-thiolation protein 1
MDRVVDQVGRRNNCGFHTFLRVVFRFLIFSAVYLLMPGTFCGVFRRQALDRGAAQLGVEHIVTGHNADDIAETVLMNSELLLSCDSRGIAHKPVMRGDIARLGRCTAVTTQSEDTIRRSKPFKYAYEKEIVM